MPRLLHLVPMFVHASVSLAVRQSWAVLLHAEVRLLCLLPLFVCVCVCPAGLLFVVSVNWGWNMMGCIGDGMELGWDGGGMGCRTCNKTI